jgi:hypothetical protein
VKGSTAPIVSLTCRKKVQMFEAQFVVIQEAVDVVLRHLESVPPSERTTQLQARLRDCLQDTEMWSAAAPTRRELDRLMMRVLALHTEVTKLEHQALVAEGEAVTA